MGRGVDGGKSRLGWGALVAGMLALVGCGGALEAGDVDERPRAQARQAVDGTYVFNVLSDATVDVREPDTNFGSATRLTVDGSPERRTYLRFHVSGLEGQRVKRATLRMYATDPSTDGPAVYASAHDWNFRNITWNNAPPPRGPVLADVGAVADSAFTDWDVTAWVQGMGDYGFVLVSTTDDGVVFLSDNGTGDERDPQLVLELEPCATPRPAVFEPELDTTVAEATPDTGEPNHALLVADGSPRSEAWLFFRVATDRPIRNARLRLHVRDGSSDGPALHRVSSSWAGGAVTWNTRPALEGAPLADLGAVRTGSWVELDVSSAVTGPGTYGFALVPTSGDGMDFTSREGAAGFRPELVLSLDAPSCAYAGDGIGGTVAWTRQIGGGGDEELRAMAPDGSGGYVVLGEFWARGSSLPADYGTGPLPNGYGMALARYRADSTPVWTRAFPGQGLSATAVAVAGDGSIFVAGAYYGPLDLGAGALPPVEPGATNLFVARFSSNGQTLWSRGFAATRGGVAGRAFPYAVAVDAQGEVAVTGAFVGLLDLGGGVLVSGPGASGAGESMDGLFLARFRADGSHRWSKAVPSGMTEVTVGQVLAMDREGGVVVGGMLAGGTDLGSGAVAGTSLFVARYSSAGALLWQRVLSGAAGSMAGLGVSGDRVFFAGQFQGAFTFGGQAYTQVASGDFYQPDYDVFLGAVSLAGGDVWLRHLGTSGAEFSYALSVGPEGQVVLVGALSRPMDFGSASLGTGTNFVGAFSSEGAVRWVRSFGRVPLEEAAVLSTGEVLTGMRFSQPERLTIDGSEYEQVNASQDFLLLKLRP
ncbi:CBM96 family carbohydrate-binding protein [Pyxidicoccus xibeiensis]|uniref:CBM96 family carbohydrate-binding protein n=1 Tax=Pyxidicoccus xibeiensis TaxID=2906759 RepID=UPI0020A816FC|nr:DNRLRE domain-containing protein [Pyxidicoccus xibeiensis]MCP3140827.1 DNRLRE domain-containing protein [Pyxidicoccus xibeiensis]